MSNLAPNQTEASYGLLLLMVGYIKTLQYHNIYQPTISTKVVKAIHNEQNMEWVRRDK